MTDSPGEHAESFDEQLPVFTDELIKERTGFALAVTYPDFAHARRVTPGLQEDLERLGEERGAENVLPSFFMDEHGVVQLGLFIRE